MKRLTVKTLITRATAFWAIAVGLIALSPASLAFAQTGTLVEPFPEPDSNAALRYQRAMLQMSRAGLTNHPMLNQPIWESIPDETDKTQLGKVAVVVKAGSSSIDSLVHGSRKARCDFGIDFERFGPATELTHLEDMVRLSRLLTLRGAMAEAAGEWDEAAIIYFDGLRVGRHLTHQNTLLEALAGIEIYRNNYFALARWGTRCPQQSLVARSFGLLESMQKGLIDPTRILARESSILSMEFDELSQAYPNGDWAQILLECSDQQTSKDAEKDKAAAIAACTKKGVPEKVFESPASFKQYVRGIQVISNRFAESVSACMALPVKARLRRAAALNEKYSALLKMFADEALVDAVQLGVVLGEHEAELNVTRMALAIAASKKDGQYPAKLENVAGRFGGEMPANPYTKKVITYQIFNEGREFSLLIPAQEELAEIKFESRSPSRSE